MNRTGRRLVVQWAALAAATALVWLSGREALAAPPVWHPADLAVWWTGRGPILGTFSAARVVLGCVGIYLTVLWTAALMAPIRIAGALRPRVGRLPGGRWLVASLVGTAGFISAPATGFASSPPGPAPPQMTYLGPAVEGQSLPAGGTPTPSPHPARPPTPSPQAPNPPTPLLPAGNPAPPSLPAGNPAPPSLQVTTPPTSSEPTTSPRAASGRSTAHPPAAPAGAAQPPAAPAGAAQPPAGAAQSPAGAAPTAKSPPAAPTAKSPPAAPTAKSPPAAGASEWVVRPGDDLWSIAAATVATGRDQPPTAGEIAVYWERVLSSNRARLPDPDNPNLIFPGDRIELPPP